MLSFQNMYFLAKEETLDNRISESLTKVLMGVKDQPGFMFYWNTRKSLFFVEFQNYVGKILTSDEKVMEGNFKLIPKEQKDGK